MMFSEPASLTSEFVPAIGLVNRSRPATPAETAAISQQRAWLFSRRTDFWLASAGAAVGLLAGILVILSHGDRELDALDLVLSEFHLGATYDAVIRRRLWRRRRIDVLLVPLVILALTYALSISGQTILLTSIAMYAAVWHRGRQSLGVARFYQRDAGGPLSQVHSYLFRGAIYLPMLAALLAYTHLAPEQYEGQPYLAVSAGAAITSMVGVAALLWVIAYLGWTAWQSRAGGEATRIHPGEWWVTIAHVVAFGSGYVLGASSASFLLVLAVHHEVQYLYFTYAMARRPVTSAPKELGGVEVKVAASFLRWPVIGFVGAIVGSWLDLQWLAPLGVGGLFCHYWLDARIWTRQSS